MLFGANQSFAESVNTMFDRIYSKFESFIEPYPVEDPTTPPMGLVPFCWHYSKGIWPWLAALGLMSIVVASVEITLFAFVGNVVEWLSTADRETFLETEGNKLIWMSTVVVVLLPAIIVAW